MRRCCRGGRPNRNGAIMTRRFYDAATRFWRAHALAAEDEAPLGTRGFSYKNPLVQLRQWATTRVRHEKRAQQMVGHPLDSDDYRAMITSWRSAGPNSEATTIFTRQSTMDPSMRIPRCVSALTAGALCTYSAEGATLSMALPRQLRSSPTDSNNDKPPPTAVLVNEYLVSMASVELRRSRRVAQEQPNRDASF